LGDKSDYFEKFQLIFNIGINHRAFGCIDIRTFVGFKRQLVFCLTIKFLIPFSGPLLSGETPLFKRKLMKGSEFDHSFPNDNQSFKSLLSGSPISSKNKDCIIATLSDYFVIPS